jgi:hypothetical protein
MKPVTHREIEWLNGNAAAVYAGISRRQLTNWAKDGLPVKHLSARCILIRRTDIDAYVESRAAEYASRVGKECANA